MIKGYVAPVLHAHLPFVRHPEHPEFLEERWLFEAITETYIPLLNIFDSLEKEGVTFHLTMSLTPSLISMLTDELLQERYINHIEKLIQLSEKECNRTVNQPEFNELAKMYNKKFENDLYVFKDKYNCNLVNGFKEFQDKGIIEIITCSATHAFLPLMSTTPEAINAQISIGVQTYEKHLGRKPRGIWLPECGYTPSLETALRKNGIEYTILESHGILFANPKPVFGTYAPVVTPSGLVTFGRDIESSRQVWSAVDGYPGDGDYREYYRDIGHDLDYEYVKEYISPDGKRIDTGIKYYRITGRTTDKTPYNPLWARNKAHEHAYDFLSNRMSQIEKICTHMNTQPLLVCPYDAELFGHWWYEGPYFLYSLFKKAYYDQDVLEMTTLSGYLDKNPKMQLSLPCTSTWGSKGYNEVWLNTKNDWIYKHLNKAAKRMVKLANTYKSEQGILKDALDQAARELVLAQSSDWAFIMRTGTMVEYAHKRTNDHIERFNKLYKDILDHTLDEAWLREIERMDNIFPDIDYNIYSSN